MSESDLLHEPRKDESEKPVKQSKRGRPEGGGRQADLQIVSEATAIVSRCKNCGSSNRSNYFNIREHRHDGMLTQWKDCNCLHCNQRRCDIFKTQIVDSR